MVTRAPRHLVLQDCIVAGRMEEEGGASCGLTVLAGAGAGGGGDAEVEAAAPPPVVLAIAYRAGCVDIALVPAGIGPRCERRRWCHVRVLCFVLLRLLLPLSRCCRALGGDFVSTSCSRR